MNRDLRNRFERQTGRGLNEFCETDKVDYLRWLEKMALSSPGWRDVREELPHKNGVFLIYVNFGENWQRIRTAFFYEGAWSGWNKDDVLYWQPLPAPPVTDKG
jgi:hypothetical protein